MKLLPQVPSHCPFTSVAFLTVQTERQKRTRKIGMAAIILGFLMTIGMSGQDLKVTVTIPDPGLSAAVRKALAKPEGEISAEAMENLIELDAASMNIRNLKGLEWATNLTSLDLNGNELTRLKLPEGLTRLTVLLLEGNALTILELPVGFDLKNLTLSGFEKSNVTFYTTLSIRPVVGELEISWTGKFGVLQSADSIGGPWHDVDSATSPHQFEPVGSRKFFKVEEGRPIDVMTIDDLITEMVPIPSGTFKLGSPFKELHRWPDEGPQTTVTISNPFWMSKFELTQGQYAELMGNNPSFYRNEGLNAPVETVSWNDAQEFCQRLTERERAAERLRNGHAYRLPTEAQWEYACKADSTTRFSYGDDLDYNDLVMYAWYDSNSGNTTHPVGEKLANPWGLHDMHGNVYEWCLDWKDKYPGGEKADPTGPDSGIFRVFRGGSWLLGGRACRSSRRARFLPSSAFDVLGFRPVLVSVP